MTIHENEVLMFTLGLGVCLTGCTFRGPLLRIPDWPFLRAAYLVLLTAWGATILEGLFLPALLNFVEHTGYALSAILLAMWCWRTSVAPGERSGS